MLALFPAVGWCHKASDSFLTVNIKSYQIQGRWDIALRDLDFAISLDTDNNGKITWGEVQGRESAINNYALANFSLVDDHQSCPIQIESLQIDHHTDGAYAVLNFKANCSFALEAATIRYNLLFDLDATHRGIMRLHLNGESNLVVFKPKQTEYQVTTLSINKWQTFVQFLTEGVWHIWQGYDHILFLLCLLFPAVLTKTGSTTYQPDPLQSTLLQVAKIVTAFTLAHSITLAMAVLGYVSLPSRWVETTIALSVFLAAINNVYPILNQRLWLVALVFGLIHGFGFASVLAELDLTSSSLTVSLLGFNVGVEVGQLFIVAVFIPLSYIFRQHWIYHKVVVLGGSHIIMVIAVMWFIQRAFDVRWLSL